MDLGPNLNVLIVKRVVISKENVMRPEKRAIYTRVPVNLKRASTEGQELALTSKGPQSQYQ